MAHTETKYNCATVFYFICFFIVLYFWGFVSICIHTDSKPARALAGPPIRHQCQPVLGPPRDINQQQGWRGQTGEPTQPAQWLPQSIIGSKISIIADGWLVWLTAGLAKLAHFRAVWSASPTGEERGRRISKRGICWFGVKIMEQKWP